MYLSEEKRAAIRACLQNQKAKSQIENSEKRKRRCFTENEMGKVSHILFDARDGREVFTPF